MMTSAVHHIPFTFDRHICDLPQHPLKLISAPMGVLAPQVKKPWLTRCQLLVHQLR